MNVHNKNHHLIFSLFLTAIAVASVGTSSAATYVVTSTSASASTTGSLPWAVAQANASTTANYINFNISGSGTHTITLSDPLTISKPVNINATTQPGYSSTPLIEVTYSYGSFEYSQSAFILAAGSSGSTIQGLTIFLAMVGIEIDPGSTGNYIQHNYIGFATDSYGTVETTTDFTYGTMGILLTSSSNTIRNNTISGTTNGIYIGENSGLNWSGTTYSGNSIQNNNLGTDPTATPADSTYYGNGIGLVVAVGAVGNFIGPGNVISGNSQYGIQFGVVEEDNSDEGFNTTYGNQVFNNYVGVNGNGLAIPNATAGIAMFNQVEQNMIGAMGGNIISGNGEAGVDLNGAHNNYVQYNIIGLDPTAKFSVGNGTFGVVMENKAAGNVIQSNQIGGDGDNPFDEEGIGGGVYIERTAVGNGVFKNWIGESSAATQIANTGYGVFVDGDYNFIQGNFFGTNSAGPYIAEPLAFGNAYP